MKRKALNVLAVGMLATSLLLTGGCGSSTVDSAASPKEATPADSEAVINDFISNYEVFAAVPRQSKHEKAVSDTLKAWFEDQGFSVRQNEVNDLFFDVPATAGYENLPLIALQGHMDMVCVAEEGKDFDPLTDPITLVVDKDAGTLKADGTSLGADDGAGLALIMSVVKGKMAHGPLRIVLTVDEEVDMTGALAVTAEDLEGVKYLINLDSEQSDIVTVSTAADSTIVVTDTPVTTAPTGDLALTVSISGLLGGHSGIMIGEGRCNAILALAEMLATLQKTTPFSLASFEGGTADNAIPTKAQATIVLSSADRAKAESALDFAATTIKERYVSVEQDMAVEVTETSLPKTVLDAGQANLLLIYLNQSLDGVYTMSQAMEGLVESSSNLGMIAVNANEIEIRSMPRSSNAAKLQEIETHQKELAESQGLEVEITEGSRAWPVKTNSTLVPAIQKIYKDITGKEITVTALHAGLECGAFSELAPDMDMASIGPDITDAHSPDETLYLDSIQKTWSLLERLLVSLS